MRLEGRVAIVTGGASGIGLASSTRFFEEGAKVVIADIDGEAASKAAAELDPKGKNALGVLCDVTRKQDCESVTATALERFGKVDLLHANAGMPFTGSIEEVDEETLDRVIGVNLKGALLTAQAVVPSMKKQKNGSIIFTSSLQGIIARPNFAPYTAAKHGVTGLMKELALELAPWGIRVNAIAPGPTRTPMFPKFLEGMASEPEEAMERFRQSIPLGKMLEPVDVANAAVFLASEEARMVTGHTLVVDGGTTAG